MLRFVKPGDIFCFRLDEGKYAFGRIISKIITGHVAEIFEFVSSTPNITEDIINKSKGRFSPIVIDTYGLFDKKYIKKVIVGLLVIKIILNLQVLKVFTFLLVWVIHARKKMFLEIHIQLLKMRPNLFLN